MAVGINHDYLTRLGTKIARRNALVAVLGLGYVGLPLALEVARKGFGVVGIDVSEEKIQSLKRGESYVDDVHANDIGTAQSEYSITFTSTFEVVKEADIVIICVPTPIDPHGQPDLSFIVSATQAIRDYLKSGTLVILESTTYPGTTIELVKPLLEGVCRKCGEDVFIAYSPERVDPGNKHFNTRTTPKVVGGVTAECNRLASEFYNNVLDAEVYPVSNSTVAELVKIYENTFRSVNIALVNELAIICNKIGVDVWEVIEAAKTKPYGFMPFYPGPGVGGHCIPIDPLYLTWKMREFKYTSHLINTASEINQGMPSYVVERIVQIMNRVGKTMKSSTILFLGISYKRDVSDVRESPVVEVMERLFDYNAEVKYHDPFVGSVEVSGRHLESLEWSTDSFKTADLVVIGTDHSGFNYGEILECSAVVFDTRNALKLPLGTPGYFRL